MSSFEEPSTEAAFRDIFDRVPQISFTLSPPTLICSPLCQTTRLCPQMRHSRAFKGCFFNCSRTKFQANFQRVCREFEPFLVESFFIEVSSPAYALSKLIASPVVREQFVRRSSVDVLNNPQSNTANNFIFINALSQMLHLVFRHQLFE